MNRPISKRVKSTLWYLGAILIALTTVYPFIWMIATSFKPEKEIFQSSLSLLSNVYTLDNYKTVFRTIPFGRYFLNSAILAFAGVATNIFLGALAGYGYAKMKFRLRKVSFLVLLSSMMIPGIVTMVPQYLILSRFPLVGGNNLFGVGGNGLLNNFAAIILPGAVGAFAVFFMKQFFESLPDDLGEAARVDGCSEFRIFWQVYLPLILPAAMTLGIMTFQSGWNSFMWPMIVLQTKELQTLQVGLATFRFQYKTQYGPLMAGTVMSTLPTLILFIIAQKYYVQGIAFSGGKE